MLTPEHNSESLFVIVQQKIREICRRQRNDCSELESDSRLSDIGLSSLDLAELVVDLEVLFGVDPFESRFAITDITDVAGLCDAYLQCLTANEAL